MNQLPLLLLGVFLTTAASWWAYVVAPQLQLGRQPLVEIQATGQLYPLALPGEAAQGREIYRSLGCVACHTQQVRPTGLGADLERGWGHRRSVAQDYVRDPALLLGNLRVGPDLANLAARQANATDLLVHLYNPQARTPGSMMPPYRFLFDERPLAAGEKPGPTALLMGPKGKPGVEVSPRPAARLLVTYLLNLRADEQLYETPPPRSATNQTPDATADLAPLPTNAPVKPVNPADYE